MAGDAVRQQLRLVVDERERYRQHGISLQNHVEQLQETIAEMKKQKSIQNSIIKQFQNLGQRPRAKTEDKAIQTHLHAEDITTLSRQLLLCREDI